MELSRRTLLAGGFATMLGGSLVGCSSSMDAGPAKKNATGNIALWCWPGGLGKSVLDDTIDGEHVLLPSLRVLAVAADGGVGRPDVAALVLLGGVVGPRDPRPLE